MNHDPDQQPLDDHQNVAAFTRRRKAWVTIAVASAGVLWLSMIAMLRGDNIVWLQYLGLAMIGVFVVASAVLCRCPSCSHFVFNKHGQPPALGWTIPRCPHCRTELWRRW